MFNKMLFVLCALAVAILTLGERVQAQSGACSGQIVLGSSSIFGIGTSGNNLANGQFNCVAFGTWMVLCQAMTASCRPSKPKEPCAACAAAAAGKPINLATGDTYIIQPDIRVPGLGGGLSVVRTWNSAWPDSQIASLPTSESRLMIRCVQKAP